MLKIYENNNIKIETNKTTIKIHKKRQNQTQKYTIKINKNGTTTITTTNPNTGEIQTKTYTTPENTIKQTLKQYGAPPQLNINKITQKIIKVIKNEKNDHT